MHAVSVCLPNPAFLIGMVRRKWCSVFDLGGVQASFLRLWSSPTPAHASTRPIWCALRHVRHLPIRALCDASLDAMPLTLHLGPHSVSSSPGGNANRRQRLPCKHLRSTITCMQNHHASAESNARSRIPLADCACLASVCSAMSGSDSRCSASRIRAKGLGSGSTWSGWGSMGGGPPSSRRTRRPMSELRSLAGADAAGLSAAESGERLSADARAVPQLQDVPAPAGNPRAAARWHAGCGGVGRLSVQTPVGCWSMKNFQCASMLVSSASE
eukprot:1996008-Rhodomonas_salina.1